LKVKGEGKKGEYPYLGKKERKGEHIMEKGHKEMTKRLLSVLVTGVVLLAGVLLSGCSKHEDLTDSDGDGVPDKLEINGYFWKDGKFREWDGNPKVTYYRTDPTQPSTDQDPYSDGMEVSGIKMDASVAAPGNHPLVPAYPDIYVSMVGYDVETNADITNSTGGKTQSAWMNSTTDEKTMEHHWDVSVTATTKVKVGTEGLGAESSLAVTVGAGGKYGSRNSITNSTSGFSDEEWHEATTINPAQAATIKLRLRFENQGTADGQNIIPTVNIILGDRTISTYKMTEDQKILVLAVNERFPPGSEWVIGDIMLTLDELKSIQLGEPLFLDMPQMDAEVVVQDEEGHWRAVDTWQKYKAPMDGVCARISIDLGDGKMKDYRVYAKSPNGPQVTLRDALKWTVGYEETVEGVEIMGAPVGNWRFGFSDNAIDNVMAQLEGEAGNNVLDVILDARWEISIKAPSGEDTPEIVWCHDSQEKDTTLVKAMVIDDYEVTKVVFKATPDANGQEMERELAGTGIYHIELPDYSVTGEERIEATNDRDKSAIRLVDLPRRAPIADGDYVITSVGSNKSLYVDSAKAGANVVQYQYDGYPNQQWSMQHIGRGYYRIMAKGSEEICLEVVESRMTDNANVQQHVWYNTDNQKWALEPAGDGCYKIIARHSGKYLDLTKDKDETKSAIQNTGSDSNSQKWIVQPAARYPVRLPTRDTGEEHFIIFNKRHRSCLDVMNGGKDDGTPIVHYSWWGGDNQRWRLVPVGDGYFRICAKHSDRCLTVKDNNVLQQANAGDDSQKWLLKRHERVQSDPNYYHYEIENRLSGVCLTVNKNGTTDAVQVDQYTGGDNQKWQLKPAEESWLNNIAVTADKDPKKAAKPPEENAGWEIINVDLNRRARGDYIFLWLRGPMIGKAIVTLGNYEPVPPEGWEKIKVDLNQGCREDSSNIWLWVRGPAKNNIAVTANKDQRKAAKPPKENAGWIRIDVDLNKGSFIWVASSRKVKTPYIYLWVR